MPRTSAKASKSPKKLKQSTLDLFRSSSPAQAGSPSAAASNTKPATHRSRKPQHKRARSPLLDKNDKIPQADSDAEGGQSSDAGAIHFEPQVIDLTSDEESPHRSPAKKRKTRVARAESEEDIIDLTIPAPAQEETNYEVIRTAKGKGKLVVVESDEEEMQPKRRRLVRGVRPPSPEEDESDLLDELDEDKIIEPRFRMRNKKSDFQRNLEKLKRKKRGRVALSESTSSNGEADDADEEVDPFPGARPDNDGDSGGSKSESNAEAEDTFIVEDDNTSFELPAQFSMNSYQDLVHHFKIICQLFVHLAVQKPKDRPTAMESLLEKQYFAVPLQMTRRKLIGMRDSLVTSSVWRPDFKNPLEKYPDLEVVMMDFTIPGCHACHLGGRMSTRLARVSGTPYDKLTYEPLEPDSSDDEGDGERPAESKEFHLGRFCARRTQVFHQFTHWEFKLFRALSSEVNELQDSKGTHGFVRVAHARGRKPPEDLSDADGIMEWLDERKIIDMEWQNIRKMTDNARKLEVKGGQDED